MGVLLRLAQSRLSDRPQSFHGGKELRSICQGSKRYGAARSGLSVCREVQCLQCAQIGGFDSINHWQCWCRAHRPWAPSNQHLANSNVCSLELVCNFCVILPMRHTHSRTAYFSAVNPQNRRFFFDLQLAGIREPRRLRLRQIRRPLRRDFQRELHLGA